MGLETLFIAVASDWAAVLGNNRGNPPQNQRNDRSLQGKESNTTRLMIQSAHVLHGSSDEAFKTYGSLFMVGMRNSERLNAYTYGCICVFY